MVRREPVNGEESLLSGERGLRGSREARSLVGARLGRSVIPLGATVCYSLANRYLGRGGRLDIGDLETFADALKAKFALPGSASPEDQLKPEVAALFVATGAKYGLDRRNPDRKRICRENTKVRRHFHLLSGA